MVKKKVVKIIMLFCIMTCIFANTIYAYNIQKELGTTDLSAYAQIQNGGKSEKFDLKVSKIVGIVCTGGSILAIVALVGIGIKYMMGGIEEKVEYKKTLKPYLIGALMVFSTTSLLSIVYNIFSKIF